MARHRRHVDREKSRLSVFWLLGAIIVPVFGIFAKIEIEGEEHLPERGPFVLTPNHYSEVDPLVIAISVWRLGRAPRFFAKESLFRVPVLGPAMRKAGMIPIARQSSSSAAKETLDTARKLVATGSGIIVYPEGTLTRDPDLWPMRGKTGAARLALAGDLPLIPVAQWGAQEIMPRYGAFRFWALRRRVRVKFGAPLDLSGSKEHANESAEQARVTGVLMNELAHLLEGLRGETAPAERWNPVAHGQKETGRLEPEA
ncbi:lysophospholipid acyltransferase family protein [Microbacterium sp. GXF7504]